MLQGNRFRQTCIFGRSANASNFARLKLHQEKGSAGDKEQDEQLLRAFENAAQQR
jgi:hypothetical protein